MSRRASVACQPGQRGADAAGERLGAGGRDGGRRGCRDRGPQILGQMAPGCGAGWWRAVRSSSTRRRAWASPPAKPFDRPASRRIAVDDDRVHRVAERRRDGGFGPGLDLEVVEHAAGDAVDARQAGQVDLGPDGVERLGEGLGAGLPAAGVVLALAPVALGRGERGFGLGVGQRVGRCRGVVDLRPALGQVRGIPLDPQQLGAQRAGIGDERLDHPFVGRGGELALEPPALLGQQCAQTARPLPQRLDPHQRVGDVAVAGVGERLLRVEHRDVELAQPGLDHGLIARQLGAEVAQPFGLGLEAGELVADEVQADRPQLGDETVVAAGGVRLLLERRQAAADLAEEVVQPQQVALGGLEPALGPLPALAVLEDTGGLLDHRPAVLGAGREDRVELALAHDDVLLAADSGVGEQLLDVEEPAGGAVDGVLGVPVAKERPGDRDLGELDREQVGAVVDRERHLGATEGGAVRRPGEDDVVHLAAAQGAGALGTEHPGDRVDEVRLPRAVRADDDHHARLELEHRLVGEGLETPQGQRLQEHAPDTPLSIP